MKPKNIEIILFLVFFDQLIKWIVVRYYPFLVYKNFGTFFGFIQNPIVSYLLLVIGFGILIWIILRSQLLSSNSYSLVFILAGGISNLIDRIIHGYVIDYANFINLNKFNLADLYILIGIVFFLILLTNKK